MGFVSVLSPASVLPYVMWHLLDPARDGDWCARRLREIGYAVETLFDAGTHGMLWAFRG